MKNSHAVIVLPHLCLVNLHDNPKSQLTLNTQNNTLAIFDFGNNDFLDNTFIDGKNICDNTGKVRIVALEGESVTLDPLMYKTGIIKGKTYLIDSYRGFINFIYQIDWMLRIKRTNKNGFVKDYFPDRFFHLTDYENGFIPEQR